MKIRNKLTGEIREVNDNELPNYGIQAPVQQPVQQPIQPQQPVQQPEQGNIITNIISGITKPFTNTAASALEALFQAGRFAGDENLRKSVLGQKLTDEENRKLAETPATLQEALRSKGLTKEGGFLDNLLLNNNRLKDQGSIIKGSVGDALQEAAYAIPMGGGIKSVLTGGAIGGGMFGGGNALSNDKNWDEIAKDTVTGGLIGAGGALAAKGAGALFGKIFPKKVATELSRPEHQKQIEDLLNAGDTNKAQELVNALSDSDPYKKSMQKLISTVSEEPYQKVTPGVKTYLSNFTIPTKIAGKLKPQETASDMIKYGINGNLDDIGNQAAKVSGENGILSKLNRDVIASTPGEINISKAMSGTQNSLDKIAELTPNEQERIFSSIRRMLPTGSKIDTANPLDVFDAVKELEKLGYQYKGHSTYLTGNVKAEQIGDVYLGVADELKNALESGVKNTGTIQNYITPEVMDSVSKVSPKLAEDLSKVKTIADLRKLQAPFVRIQRMVDLTNDAQYSSFQNLAGQLKGASKLVPSVTDPLAFLKPVLSSAKFNTKAGSLIENAGKIGNGVSSGIKSTVQGAGNVAEASTKPAIYSAINGVNNPNTSVPQTPSIPNTQNQEKPVNNTDQIKQYLTILTLLDPKNANAYKLVGESFGGGNSSVGKISAQNYSNAKSGNQSLNNALGMLFDQNGNVRKDIIIGGKIPGRPTSQESRRLEAELYNVADAFLRLRTGATANPSEIKKLADSLTPGIFDDADTIKTKLNIYKNVFDNVLNPASNVSDGTEQLLNLLGQ